MIERGFRQKKNEEESGGGVVVERHQADYFHTIIEDFFTYFDSNKFCLFFGNQIILYMVGEKRKGTFIKEKAKDQLKNYSVYIILYFVC